MRDGLPHVRAVVQYRGHPLQQGGMALGWDDLLRLGRDVEPNSKEGRQFAERVRNLRANKCCSVVYTVCAHA